MIAPCFSFARVGLLQTFLVTSLFLSANPGKASEKIGGTEPIQLPAGAAALLREDLPLRRLAFDATPSLWILGNHSLWHWQLKEQTVRRIRLASNPGETLEAMTVTETGIVWAATADSLYQVSGNPVKVQRNRAPIPDKTVLLSAHERGVYWLRVHQSFFADSTTLVSLPQHVLPENPGSPVYFPQTNQLWYTEGSQLVGSTLNPNKRPKTILKIPQKIREMVQDGQEHVFFHSGYSLLRMHVSGQLVQTIPVFGQRKLILAGIGPQLHGFLFNDRLLEIKDLVKKTSRFFRLEFGRAKSSEQLQIQPGVVAFLADGMPKVFQLEAFETATR